MNIFRKVAMCVLLFALILVFGLHVQCDEDLIVPDTERKEKTVGNTTPPEDLIEEVSDETEDEETYSSSLVINKQLISGVWHVGCDVMGNQAWVKDEISNPQGIKSREGHRLNKCGDPTHWIIYLDTNGVPFMMDEIQSGATGGTLHTKIYTDATYQTEMSITDIHCGERIYWTTWHNDQVWHHTGITTPEIPSFSFVVNGVEYSIEAGSSLHLFNLGAGVYQIIERYDPLYFVADVSIPFVVSENCDVVAEVTIGTNDEAVVTFTNQRITPEKPEPETDPPTPPQTVPQTEPSPVETEQPTEIQTEPIQTETPHPIIETDTEIVTETDHNTKIETESETVTELFTESEVVILPQIFTEVITEENTETVTEVITEAVTEKQTEKVTELNTEKKSEPVLRNWNSIEIEYTIPEIRHTEVIPSVDQPTDVLSRQDPMGAVLGSNREKETEQAKKKKRNKSGIQGINRENGTELLIISSATVPKTGDDTDILRWVITMMLAGLVIGSVVYAFINRD